MQTIKKIVALIFLTILFVSSTAQAKSVTLAWDANTEPDVIGYRVYYSIGTAGPPYNGIGATEGDSPIDAGPNTTITINNLPDDQNIYFASTAYNSTGLESDYSVSVMSAPVIVNQPPVISGSPVLTILSGQSYSFAPVASDADGQLLSFSIINQPAWSTFDTDTGRLSGTPTFSDSGNYTGIIISVTDGVDSALLPAFGIEVQPDLDTDGVADSGDNCPLDSNNNQFDTDLDGIGDVCDNCPDQYNPEQSDICSVTTGSISGRVLDASTAGIEGVKVSACIKQANSWLCNWQTLTGVDGIYQLDGLDSGDYQVRAEAMSTGFTSEIYDDSHELNSYLPVAVNNSTVTNGIDFVLDHAGSISGTVVDSRGLPIPNLTIAASQGLFDSELDLVVTTTDSAGHYLLEGIPVSDVYVICRSNGLPHIGEYYPNAYNKLDASLVTVSAGIVYSGIDFQLEDGTLVTGLVTLNGTGPAADSTVSIFSNDEQRWHFFSSLNGDVLDQQPGQFGIILPSGSYKLWANPGHAGYANRFYQSGSDGTYYFNSATEIVITGSESNGLSHTSYDVTVYAEEQTVSGSINYGGTKNGLILYMATAAPGNDYPAISNIGSGDLGVYTLNIPSGNWYIQGFMDTNLNLSYDIGEPFGEYPVAVAGGATNVNITLIDSVDSDGDGVVDEIDNSPQIANPGQEDFDGDAVGDVSDAFPSDIAASVDSDGDGYPDSWNSGYNATDSTTGLTLDVFPHDPMESVDSDGDGVGDVSDAFPSDIAASVDTDGDGYPNFWNPGYSATDSTTGLILDPLPNDPTVIIDRDGDGEADVSDAFPADIAASVDSDGDGYPDSWNLGYNAIDSTTGLTLDAFPNDPMESVDSDGDGVGDVSDAYPSDIAASVDTDGDGYPNFWNPGYSATDSTTGLILDPLPNDPTVIMDSDGDGVNDDNDAFPFDANLVSNGDLDQNGTVEVVDAMYALRLSVGLETLQPENLKYGDVAPMLDGQPTPDTQVNAADAMMILRKAIGLMSW